MTFTPLKSALTTLLGQHLNLHPRYQDLSPLASTVDPNQPDDEKSKKG